MLSRMKIIRDVNTQKMFSRLVIYFLLTALLVDIITSSNFDYCSVKCKRRKAVYDHTVCTQKHCPVQQSCRHIQQIPLTLDEKLAILDLHNQYRNNVSLGLVPHQPSAANMMELVWDDELEYVAQCWANACRYEHDKCRDNRHREAVGQNIGLFGRTSPRKKLFGVDVLKRIVGYWFEEHTLIENAAVLETFVPKRKIGHYTQLVWAKTDRVGCARIFGTAKKEGRLFNRVYLYCNYAKAGNYKWSTVYKFGKPCSVCECSTKYRGLCSNDRKVKMEDYYNPSTWTKNSYYFNQYD